MKIRRALAVGLMAGILGHSAQAQLFFTNGNTGAAGGNWATVPNWTNIDGSPVTLAAGIANWAGSNLVFNTVGGENTNNVNTKAAFGWVTWTVSTTTRSATAANPYFWTGFTNQGNNTVFFGPKVTFSNAATVHNEGSVTFSATMTNLAGGITFSSAAGATTTVSGVIGVAAGLTKTGAGALLLSGANTYAGGVTLNDGSLRLGNNAALGTGTFTINGGTIDVTAARTTANNNLQNWNGDFTFGGANTLDLGTGAVTLGGNRSVSVEGSTLTVGGAIGDGSAGYRLTKLGTGTMALSGANTYGGGTVVGGGALQVTNTAALPNYAVAGRVTVSNGATLTVVYGGAGDWNSAQVDSLLAVNGGGFLSGSTLGFNTVNGSAEYASAITMAGLAVAKSGANTLILSGANSHGGGTSVAGGVLNVTNDTALGASGGGLTFSGGGLQTSGDMTLNNRAVTLAGAGTFTTDAGTTLTVTNDVGGTGVLTKAGAGTLTLSGNVTLSSAPGISEGVLNVSGLFSAGNANIQVGKIAGTAARLNILPGASVTGAVLMAGNLAGATGLVYQTGGDVTPNTSAQAGGTGGSYGEYHLYGGTLNAGPNLYICVNPDTRGFFEMTNGTMTATTLRVGRDANAAGTNQVAVYQQSGGTATVSSLRIGGNGTSLGYIHGTFLLSNGVFASTTFDSLAGAVSSTGRLYLGNASVATLGAFPTARGAGSYAEVTFDLKGGSLTPAAASAGYMSGLDHAYLTTNGVLFDVPGARDITILQPFEDAPGGQPGTLAKTGAGVLTLAGTNTYSGFTDLRAGALSIASTNALPGLYAAGRYVVSNGAALAVGNAVGDAEFATILGAGNLAAGAAIGFDTSAGDREYAPALANTGAGALGLAKVGTNALILPSANSFSGGTFLYGGRLALGDDGALGAGDIAFVGAGGQLSSSGTVTRTLANNLAIRAGAVLGHGTDSGTLVLNGNVDLGGTVQTVRVVSDAVINGIIADGGLLKTGTATLTLSGSNTYAGGTSVGQGRLQIGGNNALGSGPLTLTAGGMVSSDGASARLIANDITITAASTLGDTVNNGVLTFSGTFDIGNGNPRNFTNLSDVVVSGVFTNGGNGGFYKSGPGSLILRGAAFVGNTSEIRGGNLIVDGAVLESDSGIRANAKTVGDTVRVIITNGASYTLSGGGTSIRVGYDGGVGTTNYYDIAASATSTDGMGMILRKDGAVNIATLFSNGVLTVSSVTNDGAGANNTTFNFDGGILRAGKSFSNFMSGLGAANVMGGGAAVDTVGYSVGIAQSLLDGGGGGGLAKLGPGVLTLSGANAYTGLTDVREGVLSIATTGALPGWAAAGRYVVSNGAALAVGNAVSDAEVATILGTGNFAAGAAIGFDTSAGDRPGAPALADTVNGALGLVKLGANTLTLSAANTHSGGTLLLGGTLNVTNDSPLGAAGAALTFNGGALRISGTMTLDNRPVLLPGTGTFNVDGGTTLTVTNLISGTGGLTKTGAGTLMLTGANTYDGVTMLLATGVLAITHGHALGSTVGGTIVSNGTALEISGGITVVEPLQLRGAGIGTTGALRSRSGSNTWNTNIELLAGATIQCDADTLTINGDILRVSGNTALTLAGGGGTTIVNGVIGNLGTGNFIKGDDGVAYLNNLNTFTDQIQLNNGLLVVNTLTNIGTASSLGTGTTSPLIRLGNLANVGTLRYTGGATSTDRPFQVGNNNAANAGGGVIENYGSGALSFTAAAFNSPVAGVTVARLLTLGGPNAGTNTIFGAIADNDAGAGGTVALAKKDAGTWILAGANGFSGGATVGGGVLQIDGELINSGVTVSNGATLKGSGRVGGLITMLAGATLAPGSSPGTLTVSNNVTFSPGSTFTVELGGTLAGQFDHLLLAGASDTLTLAGATLAVDLLNNDFAEGTSFTVISGFSGSPGAFDPVIQYQNAGAFQGSGKSLTVDYNESDITLTVVPEPSTLGLLGICACAALLWRRRR